MQSAVPFDPRSEDLVPGGGRPSCYRDLKPLPDVLDVVAVISNPARYRSRRCSRGYYEGELTSSFFNFVKSAARRRGIAFELDPKYLWELFVHQDRRCALSGVPLTFGTMGSGGTNTPDFWENQTASIDRIDSDVGYVIGNVRWVHKTVNKMRLNMSDAESCAWCELVVGRMK